MTIEDERTETTMPSSLRKLELDLGVNGKREAVTVRNSNTV